MNDLFLLSHRINVHTFKGVWVYKVPSPVRGPGSWGNPEVLLEAGVLDLPNGMVWDMSKRRVWYGDTAGAFLLGFAEQEKDT